MNFLHIAGFLGADPEVRFTSSGQKVTTLRVAARVRRSSKDDTIWWRVTIWGESFDKMISYLKKGSAIVAMGEITKPEIFTDREGKPQISMSMTATHLMFSPFGRPDSSKEEKPFKKEEKESSFDENAYAGFSQGEVDSKESDDDIPF